MKTVGEYSIYSAIQFGLSYIIGANLPVEELALVSYAMMTATFFTSLLRAGLLAPLVQSEIPSDGRLTPSHWRVVICWATAVGGLMALAAGVAASGMDRSFDAKALMLSVPVILSMPAYDFSRRRSARALVPAIGHLAIFAFAVAAAAATLALIPSSRTALIATILIAICYFVASARLLREVFTTSTAINSWRQAWSEAGTAITHSPITALATGAIMQALPISAAAAAGSPSFLALFYVSRILAMPAANVLQSVDAMQKADCQRRHRNGTLTSGAFLTGGSLVAFIVVYAVVLMLLPPTLQSVVASAYSRIGLAAVWGWAAVLAAQAICATVDNVAFAQSKADLVAYGRSIGAITAFALWYFTDAAEVSGVLLIMAAGFVVSGVATVFLMSLFPAQKSGRIARE